MGNGWMTAQQIAERRGVSSQAVYKQIKARKKELEGHTQKHDGATWYDPYAINLLDSASNTSPAIIVESSEKAELEKLQERIRELEQRHEEDVQSIKRYADTLAEQLKIQQEHTALEVQRIRALEDKEKLQEQVESLQEELNSYQRTVFGLYRKNRKGD